MRKVQGTTYPMFRISYPSRASQICATSSEPMNTAKVAKATAPPPANPFSAKKRNSAGGNLRKRQRGRLVGRVRLSADRRRGSEFALIREIGSDFGVKSHQIGIKAETVALSGGFFGGGAQRLPAVFQGGDKKLVVVYDDFFLSHF